MNKTPRNDAWISGRKVFLRKARNTVKMPDPRPTPGQGIDTTNPTVIEHDLIHARLIDAIDESVILSNGIFTLNPYGSAPLSGAFSFYVSTQETILIEIFDLSEPLAPLIEHEQSMEEVGPVLLPILGFLPDTTHQVKITGLTSGLQYFGTVQTEPLPPTDAEGAENGFPAISLTSSTGDQDRLSSGMYFAAIAPGRYNICMDNEGRVRWFSNNIVPVFNFYRLSDGMFLASSGEKNDYFDLWKFDMLGRVHMVYKLYERAHHSLLQLPSGELIYPSENLNQRTEIPRRNADTVAILNLSDGSEVTYYDLTTALDLDRSTTPSEPASDVYDWCHMNQAYIDTASNIIVTSCRNQSAVVGIEREEGGLVFIMGSHDGWAPSFEQFLLQPIGSDGQPLYDLNDPEQSALADLEFWNWGQHHTLEMDSGDPNFLEFWLFNNGNYRSRDESRAIMPDSNYSSCIKYRIDLENMTVEKISEYGHEIGSSGYSSFVSTKYILENGNLLVNFGGNIVDENGRHLTLVPGYSDVVDPDIGSLFMGRVTLQELDIQSDNNLLLEIEISSGLLKEAIDSWRDLFCFRAYKMPLYPNI